MATGKLVGRDDVAASAFSGANCIFFTKYTAVATGVATEMRIRVAASTTGNVICGVYADDGTGLNPTGNPLATTASYAVTSGSERSVVIPLVANLNITIGTVYWLAHNTDATLSGYKTEGGCRYFYKGLAYGALPSPVPGGLLGPGTGEEPIIAGWGTLVLSPSSISQPIAYGTPKLIFTIKPSSLVQQVAYGTPTVLTSALIIQPSSIVQVVAIGTPTLRYPQTLSPSSIVHLVAVGTPWIGIFGFIRPQSIVQQIAIGSPTLLKYVWHVILDGQYTTETPEVNRAYIIGRDQYGNPVYGTAVNTDEVALVGERLDFQPDPAIPTTAQAGDVASAVLSKMRLSGKRGVILIPPNCGQEIFDVVQITDSGANQAAVSFRVVGIRFEYNPKQTRYQHKLILGAP
jgi:hypothetical protein